MANRAEPILEKFARDAAVNPDRPLYNFLDCERTPFGQKPVTIGQAWQHARDLAEALRAKGAKPGDRAIILCMQDEGTVNAVWGCMIAGVVFTVIPPPIDAGKLARFISVLKSCRPKFLISNEGLEKGSGTDVKGDLLRGAFLNVVSLRRIYTDKIPPAPNPAPPMRHGDGDLVYLQYTSGSTSAPKGVMVTHGNLMACIDQCLEQFDFQHTHNNLASWVPFYHNIGLIVAIFLPVIANDGVSYFIPTLQFLAKPTVWLDVLSDFKVNITAAPNSAYEVCTRLVTPAQAAQYDLSHMTHLINGSEFVDAATVDKFCRLFSISPNAFAPGYGLSECVCVATVASMDYQVAHVEEEAYRAGRFVPAAAGGKAIVSVGRPAGDMHILAVRPDGTPCAEGEIGEIYIQGASVCAGYWQNPEETRRFEAAVPGHPGRFYRTGDMGVLYEGRLYLTGRIKEMVIIGGKNIFPSDITLMLHQQGVALPMDAVTVFSVRRDGGERPILCAECPPQADCKALALQVNRLTARHFGFSFYDVVFVRPGTLPRTDNRKVQTLKARGQYEQGSLAVVYRTAEGPGGAGRETDAGAVQLALALPAHASPAQVQPVIERIFRSLLPGTDFGPHDSFLALGGDSLRMMELVCGLEQALDVHIDLRQVAADPTAAGIAAYISALLNGGAAGAGTDLRAQCRLDEDIRPAGQPAHRAEDAKIVFLTGATGFLGAYLIRELILRRRDKGLKIYCHVRAKTPAEGMERLAANLRRFALWQEDYRPFLVAVPGDLTQPRLGMCDADWQEVARQAQLVIHNGAVLNFILPYSQLKAANVDGTAEALRLACTGRPKYFHYISSYSVYDNPSHFGKTVSEDDPLDSPDGYFLGYSETKWVAEHLVAIARRRGLQAAVYRPGDITGAPDTGIWKLEDLISRSLVGCVQLGAAPDIEVNLHLTPVDFVARAIVHIAFQSAAAGHGFNLLNKHLLAVGQISALLRRAGYRVQTVPYEEWCARLTACAPEENVLRVLSCLFTAPQAAGESLVERFGARQARFDTAWADRLLAGSGIACPPVSVSLLRTYLRHFQAEGQLPRPGLRARLLGR